MQLENKFVKEERRMAKITFFQVLKSNLKCALCKKKKCPVRYYPERKKTQYYNAERYITRCEKDEKSHVEKTEKRPLP